MKYALGVTSPGEAGGGRSERSQLREGVECIFFASKRSVGAFAPT